MVCLVHRGLLSDNYDWNRQLKSRTEIKEVPET